MKLAFLKSIGVVASQRRERATYYQNQKSFPPVFVRRFLLRYPHAHLYAVFGLCASAMVGPVLYHVYKYVTMSTEEFDSYRREQNVLVKDRQKYGKNLWIPFVSSGKLEDSPDGPHPIAQ